MGKIVQKVISSIEKGLYFDSHFVITTIIKDHSDDYLRYVYENPAKGKITEHVHSGIAKIISSMDGKLVERIPGQSVSYNIRGNGTPCALWRKK